MFPVLVMAVNNVLISVEGDLIKGASTAIFVVLSLYVPVNELNAVHVPGVLNLSDVTSLLKSEC